MDVLTKYFQLVLRDSNISVVKYAFDTQQLMKPLAPPLLSQVTETIILLLTVSEQTSWTRNFVQQKYNK